MTRTIIPAQPGWHVAMLLAANEISEAELELYGIIAWEITRDEDDCLNVQPLTACGSMEGVLNEWSIKRPDGQHEMGPMGSEACLAHGDKQAIRLLVERHGERQQQQRQRA